MVLVSFFVIFILIGITKVMAGRFTVLQRKTERGWGAMALKVKEREAKMGGAVTDRYTNFSCTSFCSPFT